MSTNKGSKKKEEREVLEELKTDLKEISRGLSKSTVENVDDKYEILFFYDYYRLIGEKFNEAIDEMKIYTGLCGCLKRPREVNCKCYKKRIDRGDEPESCMYGSLVDTEFGCEVVMKIAQEIVDSIRARSFYCECDHTEAKIERAKAQEFFRKRDEDKKNKKNDKQ